MINETVKRYSRNTTGRDFVVGDIHGCFELFHSELEHVNFNPVTDRCFSVGDLIDRGPDSKAALSWLAKPWFHACLGNHEDMLLSAANDRGARSTWIAFMGGEWWVDIDVVMQKQFREVIARLPLALEVETAHGFVGIVHADVPEHMSWPYFTAALEAHDVSACATALWSRRRAQGIVNTSVSKIQHVICGHTISPNRRPHTVGNVHFIDTGAFLMDGRSRLTLLPLDDLVFK